MEVITDVERAKLESLSLAGPERRLSPYEVADIPVVKLVQLPQTRDELERDVDELTDSILNKQGLLAPIAVMRMTRAQFEEHVGLTNEIWHSSVNVDNYARFMTDAGYFVVVAGHRRTDAVIQASLRLGEVLPAPVHIYEYDPDIFMSIQIDENNLRRDVKPERHAKAITEIYRYGQLTGRWKSATEFAKASEGKLTPRLVQDALAFANLPLFARNYVYEGDLKYSIGVALGRAVRDVRRLYATRARYDGDEDLLQEDVDTWANAKVAHIVNTSQIRGVAGAQKYIHQAVEDVRNMIEGFDNDFHLISPDDQFLEYLRGQRHECVVAWHDYDVQTPERALRFVKLMGGQTREFLGVDEEGLAEMLDLQYSIERIHRKLAAARPSRGLPSQ